MTSLEQSRNMRGTLENLERTYQQLENVGDKVEDLQNGNSSRRKVGRWVTGTVPRKAKEENWAVKQTQKILQET